MLTVQIHRPANDTSAIHGQPVTVSGRASYLGGGDPLQIERVMVQVDGDPPVSATLTRSQDGHETIADFLAAVIITGAQGPHTITATATTYLGISASASVTVFLGPVYEVDAPVIRIEGQLASSVDPNDPWIQAPLVDIQQDLQALSGVLASNHMLIAGPNLQAIPAPDGDTTVLRLGLWVEPDDFPVLQPTGDQVLPVLSDPAAAASFALVPLLPRPDRTSLTDVPMAVFLAATGIQEIADAALTNGDNGYVTSISVTMDPPAAVITQYNGTVYDTGFTVTVTETLAIAPVAGADPPVSAPSVATSPPSSSIAGLPASVSAAIISVVQGVLGSAAPQLPDQLGGFAAPLLDYLPVEVPFQNKPAAPFPLPDFPLLVADWSRIEVSAGGILGGADATIQARDQSMVGVAIEGPDYVQVPLGEPQASMLYTIQLTNLAPDVGGLTWSLWSSINNDTVTRTLTFGALAQSTDLSVDFPMPGHLSPGTYTYRLTVSATEICGTDSGKQLYASTSKDIRVKLAAQHLPINSPRVATPQP